MLTRTFLTTLALVSLVSAQTTRYYARHEGHDHGDEENHEDHEGDDEKGGDDHEEHKSHGNGTLFTTTEVVDEFSTWLSDSENTITYDNNTYTVDGPTWFTITDCPCTQTYTTRLSDSKETGSPSKTKGDDDDDEDKSEEATPKPTRRVTGVSRPIPEPTTLVANINAAADSSDIRQGCLVVGLSLAAAMAVFGAAGW